MPASLQEIREAANVLLGLMELRISSGSMVLHFSECQVQKVETHTVHRLHTRRADDVDESSPYKRG